MFQPSEKGLRAIVNLDAANPEAFREFCEWVRQSWTVQLVSASKISDQTAARWMQGRCQELEEILRYLTSAREQWVLQQKATEDQQKTEPNKFD